MNRNPILPGVPEVPEVPADQIIIPLPPISAAERSAGLLRLPHAQSVTESYRNQVIRIWPDGPEAKAVDLVTTADPTVGPDTLFGPDCGPVYLVAGTEALALAGLAGAPRPGQPGHRRRRGERGTGPLARCLRGGAGLPG